MEYMEYGVWSMEYGVCSIWSIWSMEYGEWSMEYGVCSIWSIWSMDMQFANINTNLCHW